MNLYKIFLKFHSEEFINIFGLFLLLFFFKNYYLKISIYFDRIFDLILEKTAIKVMFKNPKVIHIDLELY